MTNMLLIKVVNVRKVFVEKYFCHVEKLRISLRKVIFYF